MGPLREHEERKAQGVEKESGRSRIPRLILQPHSPSGPESPLTESQLSEEEESRDCDLSSDHSRRTTSTNSFCSDDTGCPSSQSDCPSKTHSGSEGSLASPSPSEQKGRLNRARSDAMGEWSAQSVRLNQEHRSSTSLRGSEGDFSSSSSTGSLGAGHALTPGPEGRKLSYTRSSFGSHAKGSLHPPKTPLSATVSKDKELVSPFYRTSQSGLSSNRITTGRKSSSGRFACGDSYGIKAPNPQQYLTPLQQKEVAIRHLKTKLKDSETRVQIRESEIEELKAQLQRMREDWIEEECHRVEAQLALQEARKEIRQLHEVVETMRCSLTEKDMGIQKYFRDINVQNRKLESLLHSMELAQSGCLQDEPTLDFICDSPTGSLTKLDSGLALEDQAAEEMADSGLLANDEMANQADIFEQLLTSSTIVPGMDIEPRVGAGRLVPVLSVQENFMSGAALSRNCWGNTSEKSIQTDSIGAWEVQDLMHHVLKMHADGMLSGSVKSTDLASLLHLTTVDPAVPVTPGTDKSGDSGLCLEVGDFSEGEEENTRVTTHDHDFALGCCPVSAKSEWGLNMEVKEPSLGVSQQDEQAPAVASRPYRSRSFLMDLITLAVPALPAVAWLYVLYKRRRVPVYNISTMIRCCCITGLDALRHITLGPKM